MTRITYDLRGLLIQTRQLVVDESGVVVWNASRTAYDPTGRAIAITNEYRCDPATGAPTPTAGVIEGTLTGYDASGKVTSSQRIRGITISGSGDLLQGTRDLVGTVVTTSGTVYDSSGRVIESTDSFGLKTTFPDGAFVTVTYDALGRNATETNQQERTHTFTYDQAGRLASVTRR